MRPLSTILLLFLLTVQSNAMDRNDALQLFDQGNKAYEDGNFSEAFTLYDSLATEYQSFELCYNAGNAAFRAGQLGQSILYYERARKISPSNDDLLVNLAIANERVVDRIESLPSLGVEDLFSVLTASSRLSAWTWTSLGLNLIGFLLLIGFLFASKKALRKALLSIGISLIVLGFTAYGMANLTWSRVEASTKAVIVQAKADVKTSPSKNESNAFILHEGTLVLIQQESDAWVEIRLANGAVGWLPKSAIEVI